MAVWMVRAGEYGEAEQTALVQSVVTIGWNELPNLAAVHSREALEAIYRQTYPDSPNRRVGTQVGQIWLFLNNIQTGDLVILPLVTGNRGLAIGEVTGPYRHTTDMGEEVYHVREVKWLRMDIPREVFREDVLRRLAPKTVCQINLILIQERICDVLAGKRDPGAAVVKRRLILDTVAKLEKSHGKWVPREMIRQALAEKGYDKDAVGKMTYSAYSAKPQLLAWAEYDEDKGGAFTLTPSGLAALNAATSNGPTNEETDEEGEELVGSDEPSDFDWERLSE